MSGERAAQIAFTDQQALSASGRADEVEDAPLCFNKIKEPPKGNDGLVSNR
jgi:hypothetical protein